MPELWTERVLKEWLKNTEKARTPRNVGQEDKKATQTQTETETQIVLVVTPDDRAASSLRERERICCLSDDKAVIKILRWPIKQPTANTCEPDCVGQPPRKPL